MVVIGQTRRKLAKHSFNEKFCPIYFLYNASIQNSGKNQKRMTCGKSDINWEEKKIIVRERRPRRWSQKILLEGIESLYIERSRNYTTEQL